MQPEWIIGIAGILIAIIVSVSQNCKQSRPMLSAERYTELSGLLINEEAIRDQLRSGNKIKAIKLYREQTGVGLKEAKYAVEMMEQERQHIMVSELAQMYRGDDAIEYMLIAGNKINAIKLYRQRTGVGLKEAKDAIDRMALELKIAQSQESKQTERGRVDPDELQRLIHAGQKINAIKYYREVTGVGLKEAKEAVDWLEAQMRQNT
ncbi:MAG TPA: ribosomal protein L7/L12 [Ktedonobacteraceae bacterium]